MLAAAFALIAAAVVTLLLRRAGRDRVSTGGPADDGAPAYKRVDAGRLAASVTPESTPPENLTPTQGAILLAEQVRPEHKVAWLINAAIDGYLDMEGDSNTPVLVQRTPPVSDETATVLHTLFDDRERVTLGSTDRSFLQAWKMLDQRLESWRRTCGLWDPAGETGYRRARLSGIVAAVLGLVTAIAGGVTSDQPGTLWAVLAAVGGVLTGTGAALWACGWELRVRTARGTALWLGVEAFRQFLAGPGHHEAGDAIDVEHLERYTAWAVALGEIDGWSQAVAASQRTPGSSSPSHHSRRRMRTRPRYYEPNYARSLTVATSASAKPPSSSGGSSSDSGGSSSGVGGGAGGGGGGSW